MHYGYRVVEDMAEGLENWMRDEGLRDASKIFAGCLFRKVTEWKHLNLNYKIVARINEQKCIGCDLCHIACWDGAHQCIHLDRVAGPVNGPVEVARCAADDGAPHADIDCHHAGHAQGARGRGSESWALSHAAG